jgi:hypothetical protein
MDDLSKNAVGSIAATGQQADTVSSPEHAMTAPGSVPAEAGPMSRTDPAAATVEADAGDYRHLVSGDRSEAAARWRTAGGESWGPR